MSKVFIEDTTLTAIGDAIRTKAGTSDLIDPANMAQEITNLPGDIDPSAVAFSGLLMFFNNNDSLNKLLTRYGTQCRFTNVTSLQYAFSACNNSEYPFTINCAINTPCDLRNCFADSKIKQLPPIKNAKPSNINGFLNRCTKLTTIPDDYADTWDFTYLNNSTEGDGPSMQSCCSLRKAPKFIKHIYNLYTGNNGPKFNPFRGLLIGSYNLDEIIGYPCPPADFKENMFQLDGFVTSKNFMLDMLDENTPYTRNWTSQIIDFANTTIGYSNDEDHQLNYGFTAETRITDDASYQLLKNNPDSWTTDIAYSRYNHDSAVRTINSLPNCSASGGTNTIKFKGSQGSKTDGGAISNLTENEIAVATAKGWTVTLV